MNAKSREQIIADSDSAEQFMKEMEAYLNDYQQFLSERFSRKTVNKHSDVISYMIEYINGYHVVTGFEEITLGMVSSNLYYSYTSTTHEIIDKTAMLNMVKHFFEFIYEKHGIGNSELLKKLNK